MYGMFGRHFHVKQSLMENHTGSSSSSPLSKLICLEIPCLDQERPLTFSNFSGFFVAPANKELCHYAVGFLFAMEKDLPSQCHVLWIARFQVNRTMGRRDRLSTRVFNNCGEKSEIRPFPPSVCLFCAILPTNGLIRGRGPQMCGLLNDGRNRLRMYYICLVWTLFTDKGKVAVA